MVHVVNTGCSRTDTILLAGTVRVAAERVDTQRVLRDGRLRSPQATWDGEVRIFSTAPTSIGSLEGVAWSRIDRGAPQRIVRSATGRARKPASAFDDAVLLDVAGLQWSAFLKGGEGFVAGSSGEPPPPEPQRHVDQPHQHRHLDQRPDDARERLSGRRAEHPNAVLAYPRPSTRPVQNDTKNITKK